MGRDSHLQYPTQPVLWLYEYILRLIDNCRICLSGRRARHQAADNDSRQRFPLSRRLLGLRLILRLTRPDIVIWHLEKRTATSFRSRKLGGPSLLTIRKTTKHSPSSSSRFLMIWEVETLPARGRAFASEIKCTEHRSTYEIPPSLRRLSQSAGLGCFPARNGY